MGLDPDRFRKSMIDYLGITADANKGMSLNMDTLGAKEVHRISQKIEGWTLLSDEQKRAALELVYNPNSTLGQIADAILQAPRKQGIGAPEPSAAGGL